MLAAALTIPAQTHHAPVGDFPQLSAQADAASQANHLDEAAALYKQALAIRPSWAEGWWSLGTILYDQNSFPAAAEAFRHLILFDPKNGTARLMLGLCQYELNLDEKALKNIQTAQELGIQKDENLKHILQYHLAMLQLRKSSFESATEVLYFLVHDGVQSADLDNALGMAALLIRPREFPPEGAPGRAIILRVGHAESLGILQKFDDARKTYVDLLKEVPEFPNLHYAYGCFLLTLNDPDDAALEFLEEIQNHPNHTLAMLRIASIKYRTDSSAGIPYAENAIKLNPRLTFGHYLLGLLLVDSEQFQKAIPELELARKTFTKDPAVYYALGNAYARTGNKVEAARARATFKRLNEASPNGEASDAGTQSPFRLSPSVNSNAAKKPNPN